MKPKKCLFKTCKIYFYKYVKEGTMDKDVTLGTYLINSAVHFRDEYPNCDFWIKTKQIVPKYANLD